MLPLRDDQPRTLIPFVNWSIIVINIVAYIYEIHAGVILAGNEMGSNYQAQLAFFGRYGVVPQHFQLAVAGGSGFTLSGVFGTIFTSMFLHGGTLHLLGNMWFLWIFGNKVEDHFGHIVYPLFYLLCGLVASMAHVYANPNSTLPAVGASGAIAGVMGGYLLRYTQAKVQVFGWFFYRPYVFWMPAAGMLFYWFALQLVSQIWTHWVAAQIHQQVGGIAYWAHIGGFISGIFLIKLIPGRTKYAHGGWIDKTGKELLPKETGKV
jgi:membrane associated rhomboid family serine protease